MYKGDKVVITAEDEHGTITDMMNQLGVELYKVQTKEFSSWYFKEELEYDLCK